MAFVMTKWSTVDGCNLNKHVSAHLVDENPPKQTIDIDPTPVYSLPTYTYSPNNINNDDINNVTLERG